MELPISGLTSSFTIKLIHSLISPPASLTFSSPLNSTLTSCMCITLAAFTSHEITLNRLHFWNDLIELSKRKALSTLRISAPCVQGIRCISNAVLNHFLFSSKGSFDASCADNFLAFEELSALSKKNLKTVQRNWLYQLLFLSPTYTHRHQSVSSPRWKDQCFSEQLGFLHWLMSWSYWDSLIGNRDMSRDGCLTVQMNENMTERESYWVICCLPWKISVTIGAVHRVFDLSVSVSRSIDPSFDITWDFVTTVSHSLSGIKLKKYFLENRDY